MKLSKQQEQFYEAVIGIDPEYVAQALDGKRVLRGKWLRRVAVAVLALVLVAGGLIFLPGESAQPLFVVTVRAADGMDVWITMSAEVAKPDAPGVPKKWAEREVFCVEIRMENATAEYLEAAAVTVEYRDRHVTQAADWEQLSVQFPQDRSDGVLCRIYGWAKDREESVLNFEVHVSGVENETETLLCSQPFKVFYNGSRLTVNRVITDRVTWIMELKSTEQLVESILKDADSPMFFLLSTGSTEYYHNLTRSWYPEIIAVLDSRDDAGSEILEKLEEISKLESQEAYLKKYANREGDFILLLLLQGSYYDQLTEEEVARYEQLDLPVLIGD